MRVLRSCGLLIAVLVAFAHGASRADADVRAGVGVTRATLGNGLQIVVLRDPIAPVVTTMLNYEVGSNDEPLYGLAHATEHMMFRGSKTLSASQFAQVTAITGGNFDADTQGGLTQYFYTMPSQYLDVALHLEAARAQHLLMAQSLWNQERGAIKQEVVQDNSDAFYRLSKKIQEHIFAGTPYADDGLGSLDSFNKQIQAPQLRAFYKAWYHPNNAVFVIAGDVDPTATIAKVRALFGAIPAAAIPKRKAVHLQSLAAATFSDVSDQPFTLVALAFRTPGYRSADYPAELVLDSILNNQRSDLYALTAAGTTLFTQEQNQGFSQCGFATVFAGFPVTTKPADGVAAVRGVIDAYRANGVPADLVTVAKHRAIATALEQADAIDGLAFAWSQSLADERRRSPDDDVVAIGKVTAADVDRVLREDYDTSTMTTAYAVPKNDGTVGGGGGRASEDNTILPTKSETLPSFARSVLANLSVAARSPAPVATTFPNGLKLIVQPEAATGAIYVEGLVKSNEALEAPELPAGVATVTAQLLPYGTATYDRIGYRRALDAIAADVTTGTSFSLTVPATDFDRGVELLADDELHPAFAPEAFDTVKGREVAQLTGDVTSPDRLQSVALAAALYPAGDPAQRFATPETAEKLDLSDVKAWFAKAYRPDLTTIVVVGGVTPDAAQATIAKWFGGWSATGAPPETDPPAVPDSHADAKTIPATGRVQDQVELAETLALGRTDPAYAPMQVANTVLSGGFYASLLYHDLREVHGYVYFVGTTLNVDKHRANFALQYACSPENVDNAATLAVSDIAALATAPLPDERLRRAKALLVGQVPIAEESYNGLADQLSSFASQDLPLDEDLVEAKAELAATPADVQHAIATSIRPADFTRIVVGPAPK